MIQICPPNSYFLKSKDISTWSAKDVADSVLADKSALVFFPPSLNSRNLTLLNAYSINSGYSVIVCT